MNCALNFWIEQTNDWKKLYSLLYGHSDAALTFRRFIFDFIDLHGVLFNERDTEPILFLFKCTLYVYVNVSE